MRKKQIIIVSLALLLIVVSGIFFNSDSNVIAGDKQLAAGGMTSFNRTYAAFEPPAEGLNEVELARHLESDPLFDRSHIPLDDHLNAGLGPLHNANSCSSCHILNGRGRPVIGQSLFRVAMKENGGVDPVPFIGFQLQDKATYGYEPEAVIIREWIEASNLRQLQTTITTPGGEELSTRDVARSLRVAPPLVGLGLLEAIPQEDIISKADPDDLDGDGISGRVVWSKDEKETTLVGRFGWKAQSPTLHQQSVDAYNEDMGITTPIASSTTLTNEGAPADLSWQELVDVTYYSQTLPAPATGELSNSSITRKGFKIFNQLQCSSCHIPQQKTGFNSDAVASVINNQTIWPYTDLLVHDMGPGLDDGVAEHGLTKSGEWRTSPLWGIGLTKRVNYYVGFLHDGRARSIEEAILWHGGEANASRSAYEDLNDKDKNNLLKWLDQL